ncbi:MAG TPA: saccharopine dehydrogenase, partial [Flavobacteriales bacterium]|nr:saccharopine dehydrogenase [Flavobacteriales bacterium]
MKTILIIGAGRSSSTMIKYLLEHSKQENWKIRVGDMDLALAEKKIAGHPNGQAFQFNALDPEERKKEIAAADFVISMLPAALHIEVAKDCIALKKDVVTPSYISSAMKELDTDAKKAGIIILNEIGVDPGIDHLSGMKIIDEIHSKGGTVTAFESYCGGLVAPESDNNPWGYKFTWNPRNVVLAGQGGAAQFIREGSLKYIPYHQLFKRIETIAISGHGEFEGYANRDSLSYRSVYGLENIPTMLRGTLRKKGYCGAWNAFVQLGCTDDSYTMQGSSKMTWREYINSFLDFHPTWTVEEKFCHYLNIGENSDLYKKIKWLGIFEKESIGIEKDASPAQILQKKLEEKWVLSPSDKDMIVMVHRFIYTLNGKKHELHSSMVYKGTDDTYTAMSDTVGLPVAICTRMILNGLIKDKGVLLPIAKSIYEP